MIERITSRANEKIKAAAALQASAKKRRQSCEILAEGLRVCLDAEKSGLKIKRLFFTPDALNRAANTDSLVACACETYEITAEVAEKLSSTKSTQGIFAVCEKPSNTLNEESIRPGGCFVALESVRNPDNLGAVCRTAEALGVDGAVVFDCCDPFSPKALRASAGSLFRLPLLECDDLLSLLNRVGGRGVRLIATTPRETAEDITGLDLRAGALAVIGNEANGVSEECMSACLPVTIPMQGRAESLNAATAAAIVLWEMVRLKGGRS